MTKVKARDEELKLQDVTVEQNLRSQALAGDREAFVRLIERHLDDLYRFAAREIRYRESLGDLEPDEITPEDVVSETTLMALRELARKPYRASFEGWLRHLALGIVKRWVLRSRERRRYERISLESTIPSISPPGEKFPAYYQPDALLTWEDTLPDATVPMIEEIPVIQETREQLEATVNNLPANQREVFVLRAIEGLRFEEIAAMRQQQLQEIRALYRQARETLREQLTDRMDARAAT